MKSSGVDIEAEVEVEDLTDSRMLSPIDHRGEMWWWWTLDHAAISLVTTKNAEK